ncbi:MAG TPA: hypothetical protein VF800_02695 [Telluria sp.]|jgi:hypothetical protein
MSTTKEIQKLYSVTVTVTAVILATSERSAESAFRSAQSEILSDYSGDVWTDCEVKNAADLPPGWDEECLPYGTKVQHTIGQWLDLAPPEVVRDTKTIDMFAGVAP